MNTKVVAVATLLVAFQPAYGMFDQIKENPGQALTSFAGFVALCATGYQEYRKFSKTEDAKKQKYKPFFEKFLQDAGIVTTEEQQDFVRKTDLEEALKGLVTQQQLADALKVIDENNKQKIADLRTELAKEIEFNTTSIAACLSQVGSLTGTSPTPPTTPEEE